MKKNKFVSPRTHIYFVDWSLCSSGGGDNYCRRKSICFDSGTLPLASTACHVADKMNIVGYKNKFFQIAGLLKASNCTICKRLRARNSLALFSRTSFMLQQQSYEQLNPLAAGEPGSVENMNGWGDNEKLRETACAPSPKNTDRQTGSQTDTNKQTNTTNRLPNKVVHYLKSCKV